MGIDAKPVAWMALAYGLPSQATTDEPTAIRWRKAGGDVVPLYTHPAPQPQPEKCGCRSCLTPAELMSTFVVCPKCGDKRCPRADDHRNACTDSNDQPQPERQPMSEQADDESDLVRIRDVMRKYGWQSRDCCEEILALFQPQPVSEPMDAEAWAELHRLRAEAKGPDGYATWKEAAVSERIRRVRAEKHLTERQPVKWGMDLAVPGSDMTSEPIHGYGDYGAKIQVSEPTEAQIEAATIRLRNYGARIGDERACVESMLRAALAAKENTDADR